MNRLDLIYNPLPNEKPKMIISMARYNHVYIGFYKGFNSQNNKEDLKYFWAEHNNNDFYRCLISNDKLKLWNIDAIENAICEPYVISNTHKKAIEYLLENQYILDENGLIKKQYSDLLGKSSTLLIKSEGSSDNLSLAEVEILTCVNGCLKTDFTLNFSSVK